MINKIIELISNPDFSSSKIYLLDYIDENNGFLLNGNSVWFISKNLTQLESKNIQTQYLILRSNLYIAGVDETTHFKPDHYNVIMFKDYDERDLLDVFVSLCNIYVEKQNEMSFESYFEILIDLFQLESKDKTLNLLGLYGELAFIKKIFVDYKIDLSPYWHVKSAYDKHDFSLPSLSLEVKTTLKPELRFLIKHNQIFNEHNIIMILIRVSEIGNGETLDDLLKFFNTTKPFNQNLKFIFSLNASVSKLKISNLNEVKFFLEDVKYFYNRNLNTISSIPNHVTSISYQFDFSGQKEIEYEQFINTLHSAMSK